MTAREKLILRVKTLGLPTYDGPRPLVSLEEFFDGNECLGSIGCNLSDHPGLKVFYQVLKDIRSRPNVQDVLVEIAAVEEQDVSMWPFSDRVYIFADTTADLIATWSRCLQFDEVELGYSQGQPSSAPILQSGMQVYSIWWD
jgi:hypothetical protein